MLQLYAVRIKGFGGKAANVLAGLVKGDAVLLAALRGLLQPEDVAALVTTAARGAKAEDVEVSTDASSQHSLRPSSHIIICCPRCLGHLYSMGRCFVLMLR